MKAHPLTKLIIVICITSCSLIHQNLAILLELLLASMMLSLFNINRSEEWKKLFKQVYRLLPLILSILVIQVLFDVKGLMLFQFGFIRISLHGIITAIQVIIRLLIIIFSAGYLLKLGLRDFLSAFRLIRLPESIAVITALTIGFIPLLSGQIKQSLQQLTLRGIDIKKLGLKNRLSLYLSLIMPILGRAINNAKYLAITLDLRGFRNGRKRTFYKQTYLRVIDYLLIILSLFLLIWSVV
jgi:energy-coupling factor transport system permease protein